MAAGALHSSFYEEIAVLVPAADGTVLGTPAARAALMFTGGSGIVAARLRGTPHRLLAYYEPPAERISSIITYSDRVAAAHARAWSAHLRPGATHRPATHRVLAVPADALTIVGRYLPREGTIALADDPSAYELLLAWLGLAAADVLAGRLRAQLETQGNAHHQQRRDIRRCLATRTGPNEVAYLKAYAERLGHSDLLTPPADTEGLGAGVERTDVGPGPAAA